jgi:hypothetical protein
MYILVRDKYMHGYYHGGGGEGYGGLSYKQCSNWGGGAQGDGAPLLFFFFFCVPQLYFFTGTGDAVFILIDVQNNFYVNFNLRQLEN